MYLDSRLDLFSTLLNPRTLSLGSYFTYVHLWCKHLNKPTNRLENVRVGICDFLQALLVQTCSCRGWVWVRFETLDQRYNVYMAILQANQSSDMAVGRGEVTAKVVSVHKMSIARGLLPVSRAGRGKHTDFTIDRQQLRD